MAVRKSKIKELLYFKFADIITEIEYSIDAGNRLSYMTHRAMTDGERMAIEQYLLYHYAPRKTTFRKYYPAMFVYHGTDKRLLAAHDKIQTAIAESAIDQKNIDAAVADLKRKVFGNFNLDGSMN